MRSERGRLPQALVDVLLARGIERSELHGCRPDEIERVRVAQRVDALPSVYVEFLTVMGREAGAFLPGTDVFYPHPVELKTEARALLSENGVADFLGDSEVVVSMHQGFRRVRNGFGVFG